jgi:hypothetical protein
MQWPQSLALGVRRGLLMTRRGAIIGNPVMEDSVGVRLVESSDQFIFGEHRAIHLLLNAPLLAGPANRHHLTVPIIVEHWNISFTALTPHRLHVSFNAILQVVGEELALRGQVRVSLPPAVHFSGTAVSLPEAQSARPRLNGDGLG